MAVQPTRRNPTVFQKTLAVNDFYLRGPERPYPLGNLQLRGRAGEIIATDGHQLLLQGGFHFPWPEDVDRWAAFLESRGVALEAQPKTHRDGARSCYFKDPDGNTIQIIHHPPISDSKS